MNFKEVRTYYKIRRPSRSGTYWEWHRSNNGTDRWSSLGKVKAVITRGIRKGYHGRVREEFKDFEVVEVTEIVETRTTVIEL